jgi:hypothetical protein
VTEALRDGLAEPQRHLGRHGVLVGDTADAVGAEELPHAVGLVSHGG